MAIATPNRPTIISLDEGSKGAMTIAELAALPGGVLFDLQTELDEAKALLERRQDRFRAVQIERYGASAMSLFAKDAKKEGAGTVRVLDGDRVCICEIKKDVKWDQDQLTTIYDKIVASGEEWSVYMRREFKVSETALKTWSLEVRVEFEKARTVRHGKPSYRIEAVKGSAG